MLLFQAIELWADISLFFLVSNEEEMSILSEDIKKKLELKAAESGLDVNSFLTALLMMLESEEDARKAALLEREVLKEDYADWLRETLNIEENRRKVKKLAGWG